MQEKIKTLPKPKILMFEDDPFVREIYSIKFREAGFELKTFDDYYPDFVDVVAKEQPDIITCDIITPTIDGWEAIKLLKKDKRTKDIPVVIIDNMCQKEDIEKGFKAGASYFLCKAWFTPTQVVEFLKNYLAQKDVELAEAAELQRKDVELAKAAELQRKKEDEQFKKVRSLKQGMPFSCNMYSVTFDGKDTGWSFMRKKDAEDYLEKLEKEQQEKTRKISVYKEEKPNKAMKKDKVMGKIRENLGEWKDVSKEEVKKFFRNKPLKSYIPFPQKKYPNVSEIGYKRGVYVLVRKLPSGSDEYITFKYTDGIRAKLAPGFHLALFNEILFANWYLVNFVEDLKRGAESNLPADGTYLILGILDQAKWDFVRQAVATTKNAILNPCDETENHRCPITYVDLNEYSDFNKLKNTLARYPDTHINLQIEKSKLNKDGILILLDPKLRIEKMYRIKIIKGDITKVKTEAIVNSAAKELLGGGGVDGEIHEAAGPKLFAECLKLGGCETGQAKLTKGYNLPAKYIIHTVGPIWVGGDENEEEDLASCYRNCLKVAIDNNIKSIAFPSISTHSFRFPIEKAAPIALGEVKRFLEANDKIEEVVFVLYYEKDFQIYQDLYNKILKK